jgi:hypothetical protein
VDTYPVYWVGRSFHDLTISTVNRDAGEAFTIQYGDCTVGGQATCVTPLEIVTSPDNSFVPGGSPHAHTVRVRGVSGRRSEAGRALLLATGAVVVDIYAQTPALAAAAARTMVPINRAGDPGAPLPPALANTGFGATPTKAQSPKSIKLLSAVEIAG